MRPFWLDLEPWQLALALVAWTLVAGGTAWFVLYRRQASHERVRRWLLGRLRLAVERGLPLFETVRGLGQDLARQADRPRPAGCLSALVSVPVVWPLARRRWRRESEVCLEVATRLQEGGLEAGLSAAPGALPRPWSDLLRRAEELGTLPAALTELDELERLGVGARQRVRARLLYPLLLMGVIMPVLVFNLVVIRPRFMDMLNSLPGAPEELLALLLWIEGVVLTCSPLALLGLWVLAGLAAPGARGLGARLAATLPGLRGLQQAVVRGGAARLLLAGLRSGLPLEAALELLVHAPGVPAPTLTAARARAREGGDVPAVLTALFGPAGVTNARDRGPAAVVDLARREEAAVVGRVELLEALVFPLALLAVGALVAVEYWIPFVCVNGIAGQVEAPW